MRERRSEKEEEERDKEGTGEREREGMPPRRDLEFNAPRALGDTTTARPRNAKQCALLGMRPSREAYLALFGPDEEAECVGKARGGRHAPSAGPPAPASAGDGACGRGGSSTPARVAQDASAVLVTERVPLMARPVLAETSLGATKDEAPQVTWSKRYTKADLAAAKAKPPRAQGQGAHGTHPLGHRAGGGPPRTVLFRPPCGKGGE